MADADAMFRELTTAAGLPVGLLLSGLVLNEKGLERGLACGVQMFCMGVSASETHSQKNTGMSVEEATTRIIATAHQALAAKRAVQLSVQSAFGCGFEGAVPEERVLGIVRRYLDAGLMNISLADTAGHAAPDAVGRLFTAIRAMDAGVELTCHFHNTYGMAVANCIAAQRAGVTAFESSVAGLGGCPFTKVAGGNACTEDLVHMFQRMGERTDLQLDGIIAVAREVAEYFHRDMPGMVYKTGPISSTRG
jgi:hydroxymethylglutaryl-CoA lyase